MNCSDLCSKVDQCLTNIEWMEAQLSLLRITSYSQAEPFLNQILKNWSLVSIYLKELKSLGKHYSRSRVYYITKPEILKKVWNLNDLSRTWSL